MTGHAHGDFVCLTVARGGVIYRVEGAVALARLAGSSERIIGLTIVDGGTGAPELATSLVAALRERSDVAVANMVAPEQACRGAARQQAVPRGCQSARAR